MSEDSNKLNACINSAKDSRNGNENPSRTVMHLVGKDIAATR